ncbi:MAG TPA: hypothetical protein VGR47_12550 [Terracidiphilus sp.]|nr:hypothetical protein [Terracidiphilus sp.]
MKCGPAIAVIAATLTVPALAQRGSSHGGSFGSRGGGGHAGFSARPGLSASPRFSAPRAYAPAPPFKYGSLGPPPAVRFNPPRISTPGFPGGRNGLMTSRPLYQPGFAGRDSTWDHNGNGHRGHDRGRGRDWDHDGDRDRDRDRFRGRAHSFQNWYLFSYPQWLGYPYVLDPGFYDWSDYNNSGYDQNNQPTGYNDQGSGYPPEYPNGDYAEPGSGAYGDQSQQPPPWPGPGTPEYVPENPPSDTGVSAAFAPPLQGGSLTVIFKGGRAPEKMQNYMVTAKTLTDFDAGHYEQIPLDQIDVAATAQANRASGLDFQVPGASRD